MTVRWVLSAGQWRALSRSAGAIVAMGAMLGATAGAVPAQAATGTAFVRVNQLGYATGSQAKRAYLMASGAENGATFSVKNSSGTIVYSAAIGANLGKWSASYPDVYALDFPAVTTPGTYTISVTGPIAATSPPFRIDTAANVYSGALANSLSFYQTERDGPDFIAQCSAHRAGAPERPERHDVPDAPRQQQRPFQGRPDPARRADQRRRWLVGRRGLPEVRADHQLHRRSAAGRVCATSRTRWARVRRCRTSPPRPSSAPTGCFGCGTTPPRPSTTRWGSARGTPRPSATTTSGASLRPTTRSAAPIRCTATSATARCSVPGRLGR